MSIIVSDVSYHYPNQDLLFDHLSLSVASGSKVSVIGNNGTGKSTLLKLISGQLRPTEGSIACSSGPRYVPQHNGWLHMSVAEALEVADKLAALHSIFGGSVSPSDYDVLNDDWEIESRCEAALSYWQLSDIKLDIAMDRLSGGEKTKVFLAGLSIHQPDIILLDEPSNHLDGAGRQLLYRYLEQSKATIVFTSHDLTLLDKAEMTYELSELGLKTYGGNYVFYREQKDTEVNALNEDIQSEEKALRLARKKAREVSRRQEKRASKGEKSTEGIPRIFKKTLLNSSENTAAGLKEKHAKIIAAGQEKLAELNRQKEMTGEIKTNFDHSGLHSRKLLAEACEINFEYRPGNLLWEMPLEFKLFANDRVRISGNNGTGKTTLIKLLTGDLEPTRGYVRRAKFDWIYLDQNYSQTDTEATVVQLAEKHNVQRLEDHEVKTRLTRFLFSRDTWDKKCKELSGGEKMRLYLCCLMIGNRTPDLIILDEPTNNLDISGLRILTQTMKDYGGCLLVISHDDQFVEEIGTDRTLVLA